MNTRVSQSSFGPREMNSIGIILIAQLGPAYLKLGGILEEDFHFIGYIAELFFPF